MGCCAGRWNGLIVAVITGIAAAALSARQSSGQNTAQPEVLRRYTPVTAQRLLKPEPENWLMIRGTYNGWGYSPLDQINTRNVARLRPVWSFKTGQDRTHQAAPVVNGGVMFVTTPNNRVIALNARTGDVLWEYRRPRPPGTNVPHDKIGRAHV